MGVILVFLVALTAVTLSTLGCCPRLPPLDGCRSGGSPFHACRPDSGDLGMISWASRGRITLCSMPAPVNLLSEFLPVVGCRFLFLLVEIRSMKGLRVFCSEGFGRLEKWLLPLKYFGLNEQTTFDHQQAYRPWSSLQSPHFWINRSLPSYSMAMFHRWRTWK